MREIYFDNAAATRCDDEVAGVALELMTGEYGNPSSLHSRGIAAQARLDRARGQMAGAMGCDAAEIIFTGSGTEANNLAIRGAALARRRKGQGIVASTALHASALQPLKGLEQEGFSVRWVDPLSDGNPDLAALAEAVDSGTVLLVCEFINGETGAVTPVAELCRQARRRNPELFVHCDGVQALGKLRFAAKRLGVDSLCVSGHKIFAPKGCGALYLRRGGRLLPLMAGGGQERGLRPGTENTPAICAMACAAQKAVERQGERLAHVAAIREYFVNKTKTMSGVCINSPPDSTPYICNISVDGFRSETLLHFLAERGIYVSSGSACSRGAASHVLRAMGLPDSRTDSALRVSFNHSNTTEEIDAFFAALAQGMETLARRG